VIKKIFVCLIFLAAIIIPLACGNQNNAPTGPIGGGSAATSTPTKTNTPGGPTSTPTNTPTVNGSTATPTPTFAVNTPVYENTYATFASPNGVVISGNLMTLAEREDNGSGYFGFEEFVLGNNGVTLNSIPIGGAQLLQGIPTPATTPPWVPVTVNLVGPQGFVNPGGNGPPAGGTSPFASNLPSTGRSAYAAVLDSTGGAATLYEGNDYEAGWPNPYGYTSSYEPIEVNGYGAIAFNNPKALTADGNGNLYVTDTGNGLLEEFWGLAGPIPGGFGLHKTAGNAGITFVNNTVPASPTTFVSVTFKSPYGVFCDINNNVWVTDTGYSPSVVQEYSFSGAVTILAAWPTVAGCKATGIAVAPPGAVNMSGQSIAGDVYVADSGNNVVEIYNPAGTLLSVLTDPHSAYEGGQPFAPSCIGFNAASSTYDLWVADTNNDYVISFH